jgi:WD40 repeat protein
MMHSPERGSAVWLTIAAIAAGPGAALAQVDQSRREIATPGLVLETGSRTAACDVLSFTNKGQFLFATGDDKVVRTWKFTPKGLEIIPDPAPEGVPQPGLRWTSHRERRGNVYAAAVSPDAKNQFIAIGGAGIRNSQFAVLDRYSGEIKSAVPYLSLDPKLGLVSIWAVAFSPSGDQVACGTGRGGVWVWDWKNGKKPLLVGQHAPRADEYNFVRFLVFEKDRLISADEHGGVYRWDPSQPKQNGNSKVLSFSNQDKPGMLIRAFALSPDGQWLAAALEANKVEIRSLSGAGTKTIELDPGAFPSALAFDPKGKRLAASIRYVDQKASFFKEVDHKIVVFDVGGASVSEAQRITPSGRIEALAFHPDGKHLAAAGGNNHEVSVYDLSGRARLLGQAIAGPGQCIWSVSISQDGHHIGFQTERSHNPQDPNHRGTGTPRIFDLKKRLFVKDQGIVWAPRQDRSPDGWQVKFSTRADQWLVQAPGGQALPLAPWETKIYEFPRCYAFIPRTPAHPTRLIVGHLYGASVFDLTPEGAFRTRILTGHDAEVTGMALSADGKRLVTASRDQTIAGWSLEDWPSHEQLGANLYLKGGRLWVGTVDQGSPIWEAGMSTGDEVAFLAVEGKIVYNRGLVTPEGMKVKLSDAGTAEAAFKALQKPRSGAEFYFGWKRPGEIEIRQSLTFLRDRPIWRFFPTKDNEWVLWRYQDFLYDTSTRGDSLIGWQRNMLDDRGGVNVKGTPVFYRAEQFRHTYHNPQKIDQSLQNWSRTAQGKSSFVDIEPPKIEVAVDGIKGNNKIQVKDKPFRLSVKVIPNSERQNQELTRVFLWVNGFLFKKWENGALRKHVTAEKDAAGLSRGIFEVADIVVPPEALKAGENVLLVQSYNKADVRADSECVLATNLAPRPQANMFGLFIGVGKYTKATPKQVNLEAPQDAAVLADVWQRGRGKLYPKPPVILVLKDEQVTPGSVLKALDGFAAKVKPDDLLVFHLGGHGVATRKLVAQVRAQVPKEERAKFEQQVPGLAPFYFLCANFHFLKIRDTTISLDDLNEKLVKLNCHKVIMLDACNSAAVNPGERKATDIIRLFTKDGVGPIIFAACKAEESAIEWPGFTIDPAAGLFAQAIVKTVDEDFSKSKNAALEPADMFSYLKANVASYVRELQQQNPKNKDLVQNPQFFLPGLERDFAILAR